MKYQTIVAGCVLAGLVALGGVGTTTGGFPWGSVSYQTSRH